MGQFCWMCGRSRPNEAFSGKNHGRHLCRDCARQPKAERDRESRIRDLYSILLRQRVISPKNIGMAVEWAGSEDPAVAELAQLVADIGRTHPGRKKRLPTIRQRHPALWARMVAAGLVDEWPESDADFEDELDHDKKPDRADSFPPVELRPVDPVAVEDDFGNGGFEDDEIPF